MNWRKRWIAALAAGLVGVAGTASATEVRVNNLDAGTGKGLDDPAAASPVGGNPGRTRGEQARIVIEFAASLWGNVLKSRVPIDIDASFTRLGCTQNGAVAGNGATARFARFSPNRQPQGALADVLYHAALINALAGIDAFPGVPDVVAKFNSALGSPGCAEGSRWYFGLDGNAPKGQTNFLNIVLHEMGHGLGFSGSGDLTTGEPEMEDGIALADIFSINFYDNTRRKWWYQMSNAERVDSVRNDGHLVFGGKHVRDEARLVLGTRQALMATAPAALEGEHVFAQAQFGPLASAANFGGTPVRAVTGRNAEGCAPFENAAAVAGHLALVDAGSCSYATKARFAEAAGATGVILAYGADDGLPEPGGDGGTQPHIPLIAVSSEDGDAFKANLGSLQLAMQTVPAGIDADGNVQMYAPRTLRIGSSFLHFDTRLSPNALMEYLSTPDLKGHLDLDLTPALLQDEGWRVNAGGQLLGACDTGVPAWVPGGVIVGANVAATAKMLAGTSATLDQYTTAIRAYAAGLARDKLLSAVQVSSLNACLADAETGRQYASWRNGGNGGPAFTELDSGRLVPALAGAAGSENLYLLTVPADARSLNIRSFGGSGDVTLLVRVGNEPMQNSYTYISAHSGNNETVVIARPPAGSYFIKLVGVRPYANVSLQASYSM